MSEECPYGDGPVYAKGFCKAHYNQQYRTGGQTTAETRPPRLSEGSPEAFWSRVDRSGSDCWPWRGYICKAGYGTVKWRGQMSRAHRVAYELAVGPIPDQALIRHGCDNPPCCNPAHLALGSPLDNMADKMGRGRWRGNATSIGEKHVRAKLTADVVRSIRAAYAAGTTSSQLAREHRVHPSTVMQVVNRLTWKHLDPPDGAI